MKTEQLLIGRIPALLFGEASDKVYLHVHGKMSQKEYAADFARIAEGKGYQTLSFDLPEHGARKSDPTPCDMENAMRDLTTMADYAFSNWAHVLLFACSIGAHFSLHTYADRPFEKCLFQSPIVNMPALVKQMFVWFHVTQERLEREKEIATPIDCIRLTDYRYIHSHPVDRWDMPTAILYGGKDTLQSLETMQAFAQAHHASLTVSENSEHPFMQPADREITEQWLLKNI